jgi:hypothetical protein
MATFMVAALNPLTLPAPPPGVSMKFSRGFYVVDATNDQTAIDLVANWDSEPAGTDYLAIPFNPKKASGG